MYPRILFIGLVFSLACASSSSQPALPADDVPAGEVVELVGTAVAHDNQGERPLAEGDKVTGADMIETGPDSHIQIRLFHNGASWGLGAERKKRVKESLAWRAPKGAERSYLDDRVGPDRTVAAGRQAERSAADTRGTAVASEGEGAEAGGPQPTEVKTGELKTHGKWAGNRSQSGGQKQRNPSLYRPDDDADDTGTSERMPVGNRPRPIKRDPKVGSGSQAQNETANNEGETNVTGAGPTDTPPNGQDGSRQRTGGFYAAAQAPYLQPQSDDGSGGADDPSKDAKAEDKTGGARTHKNDGHTGNAEVGSASTDARKPQPPVAISRIGLDVQTGTVPPRALTRIQQDFHSRMKRSKCHATPRALTVRIEIDPRGNVRVLGRKKLPRSLRACFKDLAKRWRIKKLGLADKVAIEATLTWSRAR